MNRLFCFGLGYVAATLARRLQSQGWQVGGTTRSAQKAAGYIAEGIDAIVIDAGTDLRANLTGATHLLSSIAPDETGDPALAIWREAVVATPGLGWIGYLSATSVYGDHGGAWVDETSTLQPANARGSRRIAAETAWLGLGAEIGVPTQVFRIAGIYGPGRSALDTVRSGRAQRIVKPGLMFSRVHVDDIAATLEASIVTPRAGAIYNVADDEPAPPDALITEACALLNMTPPPRISLDEAHLSPMGREFYADNKRISNRRIREALGVRLAYPNYRLGLAALKAAGH